MDSTPSVSERLTCQNEGGRQDGFFHFYMQVFFCKKNPKEISIPDD